jgi:tRNA pseudouridine55 synthase
MDLTTSLFTVVYRLFEYQPNKLKYFMSRRKRYNPAKHQLPPFKPSGVLLVDKPREWTSFDVVNFVRSRFNVPKIGHCGTLDPAATGLLVLVLGRFTKLSAKFSGENKTYDATMLLGTETDSQDMDGEITAENDYSEINNEQITNAVASFAGYQEQIPPMVSAMKVNGKKLYEIAREGKEIEREPKEILIESIEITRIEKPYIDFTVNCSKGTYIRTLCADIGRKLGCGATLYSLNRIQSGNFSVEDTVTIEELKTWNQEKLADHVIDFLHKEITTRSEFTDF